MVNIPRVLRGVYLGGVLSGEDLVEVNTPVDDRQKGITASGKPQGGQVHSGRGLPSPKPRCFL